MNQGDDRPARERVDYHDAVGEFGPFWQCAYHGWYIGDRCPSCREWEADARFAGVPLYGPNAEERSEPR